MRGCSVSNNAQAPQQPQRLCHRHLSKWTFATKQIALESQQVGPRSTCLTRFRCSRADKTRTPDSSWGVRSFYCCTIYSLFSKRRTSKHERCKWRIWCTLCGICASRSLRPLLERTPDFTAWAKYKNSSDKARSYGLRESIVVFHIRRRLTGLPILPQVVTPQSNLPVVPDWSTLSIWTSRENNRLLRSKCASRFRLLPVAVLQTCNI